MLLIRRIEEMMRALEDLLTAGKVRYLGFSDTPLGFGVRRVRKHRDCFAEYLFHG
jgi:aryl-alcohol dehydrogenase-like predicted oxidoreductase